MRSARIRYAIGRASLLLAVAGVSVNYVLTGCGGASFSGSPLVSRAYVGTQSPGDVWSWNFDQATFTASNDTLSKTYSGTTVALPTGFKKLTIEATNDSNVTIGSSAYAIEVPGTALLVKPAAVGSAPVVACGKGANAANGSQLHYNWVTVPKLGWVDTDVCYGTVDFVVNGSRYDGTVTSYFANGTLNQVRTDGFDNNDGYLTTSGGGVGALTASGTFMLDFGPNNGGAIGVPQGSSPVSITDFCLVGRQYRGILMRPIDPADPTNPNNGAQCIYGNGAGGNDVAGGQMDPETGGTDGISAVTISFQSQPSPGLMQGTITIPGDVNPHQIFFVVSKVGAKYQIMGLGTDSGGYNICLIEQ